MSYRALAFVSLLFPLTTFAQDAVVHTCTIGDLTRKVEIIYETGVTVPCEVHYTKESESPGDVQVLWRALNEAGYCEARTAEFVARLESRWAGIAAARPAKTMRWRRAKTTPTRWRLQKISSYRQTKNRGRSATCTDFAATSCPLLHDYRTRRLPVGADTKWPRQSGSRRRLHVAVAVLDEQAPHFDGASQFLTAHERLVEHIF